MDKLCFVSSQIHLTTDLRQVCHVIMLEVIMEDMMRKKNLMLSEVISP